MILAGDIGGTKTHLALFREGQEPRTPFREQIFPSRDYTSLDGVLDAFLANETHSIRRACFGVAGPVLHGVCQATNLPWTVEAEKLGKAFGIPSVSLLNDLEAMAYGALDLTDLDYETLNPGDPEPEGNRAVIAAGTGLGEALLFWDGSGYRPSASEGGHADFAPRNPLEIQLLEYLLDRFPRVSYERVLSGPGLLNIYQFFKDTGGADEPPWLADRLACEDPGTVIVEAALADNVERCVKALELFIALYGAEAGNLALKALATGGVYVGGGIAPKILDRLRAGTFMQAFCEKGRYSSTMSDIPVRVILNEKVALFGAARFAFLHLG